jgi:hypothetical protein
LLGRISLEDATMRHAILGLIVTLTLGILLSPLASAAQPWPKVCQIGTLWLGFSAPTSSSVFFGKALFKTFQPDLHDLGYVEGRYLGKRLELLKEAVPDVSRVAVPGLSQINSGIKFSPS